MLVDPSEKDQHEGDHDDNNEYGEDDDPEEEEEESIDDARNPH